MKKIILICVALSVILFLGIISVNVFIAQNKYGDDQEIAKGVVGITTVLSDVSAYYQQTGSMPRNFKDATNVAVEPNGDYLVSRKTCFKFNLTKEGVYLVKGKDSSEALCEKMYDISSIRQFLAE